MKLRKLRQRLPSRYTKTHLCYKFWGLMDRDELVCLSCPPCESGYSVIVVELNPQSPYSLQCSLQFSREEAMSRIPFWIAKKGD